MGHIFLHRTLGHTYLHTYIVLVWWSSKSTFDTCFFVFLGIFISPVEPNLLFSASSSLLPCPLLISPVKYNITPKKSSSTSTPDHQQQQRMCYQSCLPRRTQCHHRTSVIGHVPREIQNIQRLPKYMQIGRYTRNSTALQFDTSSGAITARFQSAPVG
jgi:hypothetical protein